MITYMAMVEAMVMLLCGYRYGVFMIIAWSLRLIMGCEDDFHPTTNHISGLGVNWGFPNG